MLSAFFYGKMKKSGFSADFGGFFLWNTTRECIKDVEAKSGFAKRLKEKILTDNIPLYEVLGIRKF